MPPTAEDSDVTVSVALDWPKLVATRLLVPRVAPVVMSTKVTLPGGDSVLGALALTVAVKVTGSPKTVGLFDELRLLVVVPWLTVSVVESPEPLKSTLGLKVAVTVSVPTGRA